ncbi:MAG: hypothetical protein WCC26_11335 [Terracidiphilus sp.]
MAILPKSEFPLLESDQAEVIEMFYGLLRKLDVERATNTAQGLARPPQDVPDLGLHWGFPDSQ